MKYILNNNNMKKLLCLVFICGILSNDAIKSKETAGARGTLKAELEREKSKFLEADRERAKSLEAERKTQKRNEDIDNRTMEEIGTENTPNRYVQTQAHLRLKFVRDTLRHEYGDAKVIPYLDIISQAIVKEVQFKD